MNPSTSDQEAQFIAQQKRKKRVIVALSITFVVLVTALIVSWPSIRRLVKDWRSNTFLEEARMHLDKGAGAQAIHSGALAVQLNPDNIEAIRLVAGLLTQVPHVDAFIYWNKLFATEKQTDDDELAYIRFCLQLGHLELARPHLQGLLKEDPPSEDALTLGIQFWQIERDMKRAKELTSIALQYYPDNSFFKIILSQLLLQEGDLEEIEHARRILLELSEDSEQNIRLHAYNLLSKHFSLTKSEQFKILEDPLFQSNDMENVLLGYDLKMRLNPKIRDELLSKAMSDFKYSQGNEKLILARWFNSQKAFERNLELISQQEALANSQLLMIYLDAIGGLNRWEEVQDLFFENDLDLEPIVLHIFKTRVALALNDERLAEAQWNYALSLAKEDPQKLLFVAEYFDKLRAWEYAWRAYLEVLEYPHHAMSVARRMIMLAEIRKDTPGILEVLRKLTNTFPNEEVPKVDLAYIELLLEQNVQGALISLESQLQNPVQTMALRSAAALGYLRTDQPEKALKLYEETPLDLANSLPAWQTIYAATLAANGQEIEAEKVAKKIDISRLKPEELKLIEELLPHRELTIVEEVDLSEKA